jgi:Tfp pilus assembly protein PilF
MRSAGRHPVIKRHAPALAALVAAVLLAGCGEPKISTEDQAAALAGADPAAEGPERAAEDNLAQSLIDQLTGTEDAMEAASLEEEIWEAWLLSGSPTVDILMRRGVEAMEMDDLEMARDMFDRAILIKPAYAEGWARRALIFFNDGQYDEAIADLEATLTHEPRHFGAWILLGMIFESVSEPTAALQAYRNALEIHPNADAAKQGELRLVRIVEGRSL